MRIWDYLSDGSNYSGAAASDIRPSPIAAANRRAKEIRKGVSDTNEDGRLIAFGASSKADMWPVRSCQKAVLLAKLVETGRLPRFSAACRRCWMPYGQG